MIFLKTILLNALNQQGGDLVSPQGKLASVAELTIFTRQENRLRRNILDRVYANPQGQVTILDYKTGQNTSQNRDKWRQQLTGYRQALEQATGESAGSMVIYRPADSEIIGVDSD